MDSRFKNGYEKYLYDFLSHDVLVKCPQCCKRAIVHTHGFSMGKRDTYDIRVNCTQCSYLKYLRDHQDLNRQVSLHLTLGGGIDPFFKLPLWMCREVGEELLWAYNNQHLEFLENLIGAKLRERNIGNIKNRSIASRLPQWMLTAKNRDAVLAAIQKMRLQ